MAFTPIKVEYIKPERGGNIITSRATVNKLILAILYVTTDGHVKKYKFLLDQILGYSSLHGEGCIFLHEGDIKVNPDC